MLELSISGRGGEFPPFFIVDRFRSYRLEQSHKRLSCETSGKQLNKTFYFPLQYKIIIFFLFFADSICFKDASHQVLHEEEINTETFQTYDSNVIDCLFSNNELDGIFNDENLNLSILEELLEENPIHEEFPSPLNHEEPTSAEVSCNCQSSIYDDDYTIIYEKIHNYGFIKENEHELFPETQTPINEEITRLPYHEEIAPIEEYEPPFNHEGFESQPNTVINCKRARENENGFTHPTEKKRKIILTLNSQTSRKFTEDVHLTEDESWIGGENDTIKFVITISPTIDQ